MSDIKDFFEQIVQNNNNIKEQTIVLNTQKNLLIKEIDSMNHTVLENSTFLNINSEVMDFLEKFSKRSYEENLLNYQQLLSYYVNDVFMSKNVEEKEILIELVEKVNSLAIDIYIQNKGSEHREDIVKSNGGGIANIIAVGLKVLSLFNLNLANGYRKFLVLDEADCWLKEPDGAKNEAFYKQLYEISKRCNIQIFIISHWDIPLSIPAKRVHLSLDKNKTIHVEDKTVIEDSIDCEEVYVNKIALQNFESHLNTTIELSPRITILTGDNNIGKSAIVRAFRSVFFFEGSDLQINHHANEAKVFVDLTDQQSVLWTRKRKGNVPEEYQLNVFNKDGKFSNNNNKVNEAIDLKFSKKKMMETNILGEVFGIYKYNNLDLQLGDQKDPIGILKLDSKDKAIALFSDINFKFYKKLSENHKQKYRLKQVENTLCNKKIIENESKLNILADLEQIKEIDLNKLDKEIENFNKLEDKFKQLTFLNENIKILESLKNIKPNKFNQIKFNNTIRELNEISKYINKLIINNEMLNILKNIKNNTDINHLIKKNNELSLINNHIKQYEQLTQQYHECNKNINDLYDIYFNQEINNLKQMKKAQEKIINLVRQKKVLDKLTINQISLNKESIKEQITELNNMKEKGNLLLEKVKSCNLFKQDLEKLNKELEILKEKSLALSKIICPLCKRPFNSQHNEQHSN